MRRSYFAPLVFALSIIAIIYTSLVALVQEDMKKLIAYSSVAHMGFVTMGIFAGTSRASRARSSRCSPRHRLGRALPLRRRRL
jgi:NADH:ubiquinone oxidoreductase subunit 4 (subunit M)